MFIKPMLLDTAKKIFDSSEYIYEPKSNGVRLELVAAADGIRLFTRHGNDITTNLPEITQLDITKGTILDGELVCYSDTMIEDFEGVMSRIMAKSERKIAELSEQYTCTFVVFDILQLKGELVTRQPLNDRIHLLDQHVDNQQHVHKVVRSAYGPALYELVKQHKLEGVVAKKLSSTYHVGKRPKDLWLKVINWRYSDCYITGYSKDKFGWYIADQEGNYVGTVEVGALKRHKQLFYSVVKTVKESETAVYIEPIKCVVKHRGYLKSGKLFTPVFVSFIIQ
ncbi:ATP-dependent DNA ligase [Paenibacillus marinisediminis]